MLSMGSERSLDPRQILYGDTPPARQMYFKQPDEWTTSGLLPENAEEMTLLLKALAILADQSGETRARRIEQQLYKALWIDDVGRAASYETIAKTYRLVLMKDPDAHELRLEPWQWGICLRALDHCMDDKIEQIPVQAASDLHERISRAICLENDRGPAEEYVSCCVCDQRIHHLESRTSPSGTYCRECDLS